jgi:WD40 repeat protein
MGDPDGDGIPVQPLMTESRPLPGPFLPHVVLGLASAALALACVTACAARSPEAARAVAGGRVSYSQVHQIFQESCEHCHNEDKAKGGLLMSSYEALVAGGEHGTPIVAGKSASSRLVQMLDGSITPRMPYKEDPLPATDIDLIRRWIDEGAPGPGAAGPAPAAEVVEADVPDVKPSVSVVGAVAAIAFDPDTRRIAVGGYKTVHLLRIGDRKWMGALEGHADLVRAVAFSSDGKWLAAAGGPSGRFGEIRIWNVEGEPKLTTTVRGHEDAILAIAFSPDARTIASASYDKLVKLWDVASGKETRTLKEHSDAVYTVAFTKDGKHVISGAGDRTIKIWDAASGRRLSTINDPLDSVYAVAVHPSGTAIAAGGADKMVRTWGWAGDLSPSVDQALDLRTSMFAHGEAVLRLSYSPDGSTLVTAGADRAIKVWDAETMREKALLEPQPDWVMGLAVSRDGKWLAAGRYDGTFGLYDLTNGLTGEQFVLPR